MNLQVERALAAGASLESYLPAACLPSPHKRLKAGPEVLQGLSDNGATAALDLHSVTQEVPRMTSNNSSSAVNHKVTSRPSTGLLYTTL